MRAYSNVGGMAYFPVGEIVTVEPVNDKTRADSRRLIG